MEPDWSIGILSQFGRSIYVVIVAVGAEHPQHIPSSHCFENRAVVVGSVDYHHFPFISDDPDVVIDREVFTVQ
tara:strand:- start:399 stop:617 length:219 start_codon:yes stop_codon:yes gene_type:complete